MISTEEYGYVGMWLRKTYGQKRNKRRQKIVFLGLIEKQEYKFEEHYKLVITHYPKSCYKHVGYCMIIHKDDSINVVFVGHSMTTSVIVFNSLDSPTFFKELATEIDEWLMRTITGIPEYVTFRRT